MANGQQRRRSYQPRRQQRRRQQRRNGGGGSWPAYLTSTLGGLVASLDAVGYGGSLAFGSYASASSDKQLRSVGRGLLTAGGLVTASVIWSNRENLLSMIGLA